MPACGSRPGLVDLLVREVKGEPAALPLLSHVLRRTWELREGPTLTVAGYRKTGGIRDAVAQSAEGLYEQLDDSQRAQLRALFLRLVAPTDDGEPVRPGCPARSWHRCRTREADRGAGRRPPAQQRRGDVQIAHEALARGVAAPAWLAGRGRGGQRIFRHLSGSSRGWDAMGRPEQRALSRRTTGRRGRLGRAEPRRAHRDRA